RTTGVIVVRTLFEIPLVEMARDDDVLRRRGIAGDGRVNDLHPAGKRFGFDRRPDGDVLTARKPSHQLPTHPRRDRPAEPGRSGGNAGRRNLVGIAGRIERVVAHGAGGAALRGLRVSLPDTSRSEASIT